MKNVDISLPHFSMKTIYLFSVCLLLAGCNSLPQGTTDNSQSISAVPPRYHHEIFSEFSDGETKFLHLVPDDGP